MLTINTKSKASWENITDPPPLLCTDFESFLTENIYAGAVWIDIVTYSATEWFQFSNIQIFSIIVQSSLSSRFVSPDSTEQLCSLIFNILIANSVDATRNSYNNQQTCVERSCWTHVSYFRTKRSWERLMILVRHWMFQSVYERIWWNT